MDYDIVKQLEIELNDPKVRRNRSRLDQLIADDFEEVGQSGRVFSKQDIISALLDEGELVFTAEHYRCTCLAHDCLLVRYKTTMNNTSAQRCSIWTKQHGNWQIRYHQGTRI